MRRHPDAPSSREHLEAIIEEVDRLDRDGTAELLGAMSQAGATVVGVLAVGAGATAALSAVQGGLPALGPDRVRAPATPPSSPARRASICSTRSPLRQSS